MTYGAPAYLHVSPPVEDCVATLTWPRVPMAEGYEVECLYDDSFSSAYTGGRWADLHDQTYTWWDVFPGHSWEALHRQPTGKGLLWDNLSFCEATWDDLAESGGDWAACHGMPMSHLIYRGPGIPVSDREEPPTWGYLHERSISWQYVGQSDADWYGIHESTGLPELSLPALIPVGKRTVCYRIRALLAGGETGDWAETEVHDIAPLVCRQDQATLMAEAGEDGILQLNGWSLGHLPAVEVTVAYSPYHLSVEDFQAHRQYGFDLGLTSDPPIRSIRTARGGVKLVLDLGRDGGDQVRSGLLTALRLRSGRTGRSDVTLQ